MRAKRILAVVEARNREFYRDKAGLGWNVVMPLIMIFGFAFLFSGGPEERFKVGVLGGPDAGGAPSPFLSTRHVRFVPIADPEAGIDKVRYHQLDLLLDPRGAPRYWVNDESASGYLAERLLREAYSGGGEVPLRASVSGRQVRYVDWVLPGVLALNMTFSSLWGVGWVIVRYRKNGVLRRLRATPLTALEFLVAQIASRFLVVLAVTVVVFVGANLLLDFPMRGSYGALALIFAAGSLCMISLGLLVASRLRSEELADGLLNLVSWPMMILSGVWFSMEGTHPAAQLASQVFPLTHLVDGARRIMLEGAGIAEVAPDILLLTGIAALLLGVSARLFRWQ
jgi:ABC-type multidrug transport system permease subunit